MIEPDLETVEPDIEPVGPDLEIEVEQRLLAVFDFDGTITRHDSFVPFLKFAFGQRAFPCAWPVWCCRASAISPSA